MCAYRQISQIGQLDMKAVIVGGGIGGLAAALCLRRLGWSVTVLEQATNITEVGAGLQISPNGVHVLRALGVMDRLQGRAFYPKTLDLRNGVTGREYFSIPIKAISEGRYGAPYFQVHRADLQDALMAELLAQAPDSIEINAQAVGYGQVGKVAHVTLSDGRKFEGDLVVGADGLHSAIRTQMHGVERPQFTGNVAWRTLVPMADLTVDVPDAGCIWAGPKRHAVTTKIRGGAVANFVGIVEQDDWREEGWNVAGQLSDLKEIYAGWHPTVTGVIDGATAVNRWALFGREPLTHWSEGRVCLLGDACHPMVPSFAQGAVQAFEDAWVLSEMVSGAGDIETALSAYYDARIARVSRVQRQSAKNVRMFHASGVLGRARTFGPIWALSKIAPSVFYKSQDWLWSGDVTKG
jgi:salicylate hydroxylase